MTYLRTTRSMLKAGPTPVTPLAVLLAVFLLGTFVFFRPGFAKASEGPEIEEMGRLIQEMKQVMIEMRQTQTEIQKEIETIRVRIRRSP